MPDPVGVLERLAQSYFGQALDTCLRLLALTPDGQRHRYLLALRISLDLLAGLSEADLGDPAAREALLLSRLGDAFRTAQEAGTARHGWPSQAQPPGGA